MKCFCCVRATFKALSLYLLRTILCHGVRVTFVWHIEAATYVSKYPLCIFSKNTPLIRKSVIIALGTKDKYADLMRRLICVFDVSI